MNQTSRKLHELQAPIPSVSDAVGLGEQMRISISNKFPGDTAGL